MSYSVQTPCWACKKGNNIPGGADNSCKDGEKLQKGVNEMYKTPTEHLGSGSIQLMCTKVEPLYK